MTWPMKKIQAPDKPWSRRKKNPSIGMQTCDSVKQGWDVPVIRVKLCIDFSCALYEPVAVELVARAVANCKQLVAPVAVGSNFEISMSLKWLVV